MQTSHYSALESHQGENKKRRRTDSETSGNHLKNRRLSKQQSSEPPITIEGFCESWQNAVTDQLPSPTLTKSGREPLRPPSNSPVREKRRAQSLDCGRPSKRSRLFSEPAHEPSPIDTWFSKLPKDNLFEPFNDGENLDKMSQPPSKRSRSSDSLGRRLSQSGDGSDTVVSRDKKYSVYKDVNYPVVLETKGSFMRPSKAGMVDEDRELCEKLLTTNETVPEDILFDDNHFGAFHSNLRGRSEARICADMHPRIMPSVENLCICGRREFKGLIEGHNDIWVKSITFFGPRPQPDHTYGFKWDNFTDQQRRKLGIDPMEKSLYTAREDIYFPFFTGEVKCGKQGLDLADRPNAHSMTIALRGIVNIYRRINRPADVHRRALGFSISHDDNGARIYAHYPEIDGDATTFWRDTLREFSFGDNKGKEKWTCYQFTLNVCKFFAIPLLNRLKMVINELPDPATQPLELATTFDDISVQSSQDDASGPEYQDENFKKPSSGRGLNAGLRSMIQSLQRQLEQQRADAEQERKDMKEKETTLLAQLEQQRKESERQQKELLKLLTEQTTQIKELLQNR